MWTKGCVLGDGAGEMTGLALLDGGSKSWCTDVPLFSHVFIYFGNMFPSNLGLVAVPVTRLHSLIR